jgi:hypothetical protein
MRKRIALAVTTSVLASVGLGLGAGSASAAPSSNASCVAYFTSTMGPNKGAGGPLVSYIAREPHNDCYFPFAG